ncbi:MULTISPECIES: permease [unclassified Rathayibacter]|uniref:permease n=1 Tax=unclassified Rathayibacter TaxID=2609250 RepID=UPI00188C7B12|nr:MULTISPECIES: permease [unclassified Rathayibacter]MBF4461237.1 permease [Rathayibacter sp. VKM Ac-2879]MBF4502648.1 permease [Rathayibacter sp. VKM Ac-2878]
MSVSTASPPTRSRSTLIPRLLIGVGLLVAFLVLRSIDPPELALSDTVRDFATLSISVVIESLPFVFLGILLSVAVQLWVPERVLLRVLPRRALPRRLAISLLGVLLPVCECGNVPLARGLVAKGLSVSESVTFLLAAPILNPITIVTTYQAFGWNDGILVSRVIGGFVIANLAGWLVSLHPRQAELLTAGFRAVCERGDSASGSVSSRARRSLTTLSGETSAMLPALFVGAGIAGFIQVAVSRDLLTTLGADPLWSVLALMTLAFVVSICSNVDAFFVLSFGGTFLPGAIVAFLVFGPMIDVKMLALLRTTFTSATLVRLTAIVALSAAALGLAVNLVG